MSREQRFHAILGGGGGGGGGEGYLIRPSGPDHDAKIEYKISKNEPRDGGGYPISASWGPCAGGSWSDGTERWRWEGTLTAFGEGFTLGIRPETSWHSS
jgi:hypothetical protein